MLARRFDLLQSGGAEVVRALRAHPPIVRAGPADLVEDQLPPARTLDPGKAATHFAVGHHAAESAPKREQLSDNRVVTVDADHDLALVHSLEHVRLAGCEVDPMR